MSEFGQSRRFGDVCDMSALPPTTALMMQCRERQKSAKDRDRGEPRGSAPPTPPYVRVRIRRFEKLS